MDKEGHERLLRTEMATMASSLLVLEVPTGDQEGAKFGQVGLCPWDYGKAAGRTCPSQWFSLG